MSKSPLSRGRRRRAATHDVRTPPPGPNGTAQAVIGGSLVRYAEGHSTPIDPSLPTHLLLRQLTRNANGQTETSNAMARELVKLREAVARLEARLGEPPTELPDAETNAPVRVAEDETTGSGNDAQVTGERPLQAPTD